MFVLLPWLEPCMYWIHVTLIIGWDNLLDYLCSSSLVYGTLLSTTFLSVYFTFSCYERDQSGPPRLALSVKGKVSCRVRRCSAFVWGEHSSLLVCLCVDDVAFRCRWLCPEISKIAANGEGSNFDVFEHFFLFRLKWTVSRKRKVYIIIYAFVQKSVLARCIFCCEKQVKDNKNMFISFRSLSLNLKYRTV